MAIAIVEWWLLKQNGLYGPSTGCCGAVANSRGTTVVSIRIRGLVICNSLPSFFFLCFQKISPLSMLGEQLFRVSLTS